MFLNGLLHYSANQISLIIRLEEFSTHDA